MSYIQVAPTKELAELRGVQVHRIHNLLEKIKRKSFNQYFPNEKVCQEALQFEKNEMKILMNEINKRQDIAVLTIKVDLTSDWGISFYQNISFWEEWVYQYLEEDFGISHNQSFEIENFKSIMEEHGYDWYEDKFIVSINNDKLIQALKEEFSS